MTNDFRHQPTAVPCVKLSVHSSVEKSHDVSLAT
jgi:hypothetical protein